MCVRHLLCLLALSSLTLAGCRGLCRRDPPPPYPPLPSGSSRNIPPTNIPDGPPLPPTPRGSSAELLLPQPPPGKSRSDYRPLPEPYGPETTLPKAQPITPRAKVVEDPTVRPQPVENKPQPDSDPGTKPQDHTARPMPQASVEPTAGIEDFTTVKEGVAAGLRPTLEGLDWLAEKGYKTVLYLRRSSDDDTTDKRQVEKRLMQFSSLEVKPEELNQAFIDNFNAMIGKTEHRPTFIYARDGNISAAVWYIHLRTAEFLTHDEAKLRIARLGFKDETNEYYKAALKYFEKP